jgi:hypothetical protein
MATSDNSTVKPTVGNSAKVQVKIEGTRPLLWNHFGPHVLSLDPQERSGVAGNDPDEWRRSVLMTPERELYILPSAVFKCLREGGRFIKQGRTSLEKFVTATVRVQSKAIIVQDRFVPRNPEHLRDGIFQEEMPEVFVDVSPVVNPSTKNRNIRYRVSTAPGWQCSFGIQFDRTIVSRSQMESICIQAGEFVGLGDGRSMGLGRFKILVFEDPDSS